MSEPGGKMANSRIGEVSDKLAIEIRVMNFVQEVSYHEVSNNL